MKTMLITGAVSFVLTIASSVLGWLTLDYHASKRLIIEHSASLSMLITPTGDIRPSTKVEVMQERLDNLEYLVKQCVD